MVTINKVTSLEGDPDKRHVIANILKLAERSNSQSSNDILHIHFQKSGKRETVTTF